MLLIIFLTIIAVVLLIASDKKNEVSFGLSVFLFFVAIILSIVSICVQTIGPENLVSMQINKQEVELLSTKYDKMTEKEELSFKRKVIAYNSSVIAAKNRRDSIWYGYLYYKPIGDLELIDVKKLFER